MRQAAAGDDHRSCGHRRPRGTEGTQIQPGLTRAERGNPARVRAGWRGRPIARGAEPRGRDRMPKKRMPAAERQRETRAVMPGPPAGGAA
jgi:hypothetical protein